jgi:hypothetical protein
MFTRNITTAQNSKTDIARFARTGLAFSNHIGNIIKRNTTPLCRRFAKRKRGS